MPELLILAQGDKAIIQYLEKLSGGITPAIKRFLIRTAKGIFRAAYEFLSGPGAKASNVASGGYPVPVRTGHLRRMLDWLQPGESKNAGGMTITAAQDESVIYNAALYADVIHEGTGSSAKFGPRQYLLDSYETFNTGNQIVQIAHEEINQEITSAGLQ